MWKAATLSYVVLVEAARLGSISLTSLIILMRFQLLYLLQCVQAA